MALLAWRILFSFLLQFSLKSQPRKKPSSLAACPMSVAVTGLTVYEFSLSYFPGLKLLGNRNSLLNLLVCPGFDTVGHHNLLGAFYPPGLHDTIFPWFISHFTGYCFLNSWVTTSLFNLKMLEYSNSTKLRSGLPLYTLCILSAHSP